MSHGQDDGLHGEDDAGALKRLARATGRSQASLIREAIAEKTRAVKPRPLSFIGLGQGSNEAIGRNADEIVRQELGRPPGRSSTRASSTAPPRLATFDERHSGP